MALRIVSERRTRARDAALLSRRRYPRLFLDVDWFVESKDCSTLGRGLEISPRGARLPLSCRGEFAARVTLYVSLQGRAKMFKAKGQATATSDRGWLIQFLDVSADDLKLLGEALLEQYGLAAFPQLERRFGRYAGLFGTAAPA